MTAPTNKDCVYIWAQAAVKKNREQLIWPVPPSQSVRNSIRAGGDLTPKLDHWPPPPLVVILDLIC